jgi:hypothetical protein
MGLLRFIKIFELIIGPSPHKFQHVINSSRNQRHMNEAVLVDDLVEEILLRFPHSGESRILA